MRERALNEGSNMDTDIRVIALEPAYQSDRLRVPLKFGNVVVTDSTSLTVRATVENRKGSKAVGLGAMPLSDKWAFPDPLIADEKKLSAMRLVGERTCNILKSLYGSAFSHPIDIMLTARERIFSLAKEIGEEVLPGANLPRLAVLVATSPIDAALHDAFGRANGICSYDGYGRQYMAHDLGFYLGGEFSGSYISDFIRKDYASELCVFHLVGALDKLTSDEVESSDPKDGLPVTLEDWIERDGIFCLKVKLKGLDTDWDVERTKAVAEIAHETLRRKGRNKFYLSVDANEMNPNPDSTLEYLRKLKRASPLAFGNLLYLEQPTERDLSRHMFSMRDVASIKPVLADEGVTDMQGLDLALSLGWSGLAVKTCKWHSSSLLYVAKMQRYRIPYSVQDLTCPGLALVHSAGFAARTSPIMGFEYNARQYLPFAYENIQDKHRTLFKVRDGKISTETLESTGLAFSKY